MSIKKLFSLDYHRLRKLRKILDEVNSLADAMRALSDEALRAKTAQFKKRLAQGETLDDLLPEAYAVVREVDYRVLGMFPYDVQVLGAIVLHQGNIAEMKTGEGKTLTATMPLYLNALTGKGVMLITPSDYLAKRDYEEMGPVYRFLDLTVSVGVFDKNTKLPPEKKRELYGADIHYTTNSILGFDYLIDNLASSKESKLRPRFHYAVLDEVDGVLLDTAQTPLIISGSPRVQSNLYGISDRFIATLKEGEGYYFDKERKEVWLRQQGIDEVERYFNIDNLFDPKHAELFRHLTLAIKAQKTMTAGKDYLVEDDKVHLLDQSNGRLMEGTKLQGGFHQALEEKERVKVTEEMRAMASVTYQNLFLMFDKLSGMTGTGKTAEDEFIATYNMEVVQIPTHRPVIRQDLPDLIYTTLPEKISASVALVKSVHAKGQPILLVTGSVRMSELYSEILLQEGIPHNLLNAFNAAKEAQMIAEAGRVGNVTVATNMAGRGTDIKLSPEAKALGGLAVICTERMMSQRMDLQVRGRSGRQGDPGFSQFFASLEDDLLVEFGGKWLQDYFKTHKDAAMMSDPKPLTKPRFSRLVRQAQEASEGRGRSMRDMTLSFDESVKVQRNLVYAERDRLIAEQASQFDIEQMLLGAIDDFLAQSEELDSHRIERYIFDNMTYNFKEKIPDHLTPTQVRDFLGDVMRATLKDKMKDLRSMADFNTFVRIAVLKAIDEAWVEEVDYLQQLRTLVAGRHTAQRNPVYEYHIAALQSFERMKRDIREVTLRYLLLSEVSYTQKGELEIYFV